MKILVISPKNVYAAKRLAEEAAKAEISLKCLRADELGDVSPKDYGVLYVRNPYVDKSAEFLPRIVKLAKKFKLAGKRVVDRAIADGNLGRGKWTDYQMLMKAGLPIPKTELFLSSPSPLHPLPFVLKWTYGFKGKNVFLIKNESELRRLKKKYNRDELLIQEFIPAEYEYKVITVGFKALPVVLRFAIDKKTHRPNFDNFVVIPGEPAGESRNLLNSIDKGSLHSSSDALGVGRDDIRKVIQLAKAASKALGRELAKVDILQKGNQFYILEVNRFPGLESFEGLTKFNVCKAILAYLQK